VGRKNSGGEMMGRGIKVFLSCLLGLLLIIPFVALAEEKEETKNETKEATKNEEGQKEAAKAEKMPDVIVIGEPLVRGLAEKLKEQPTTVHSVYGNEIENMDIKRTLDIIRRIPGVMAENYNQQGVASAYSFRGFRAGHGVGAGCYLDGIPYTEINHVDGDGLPDYNTILPESIEKLEVIKGLFSPLYGGYAQAGILHYITKERGNDTNIKLSTGAWNYQRGEFEISREKDSFYTWNGIDFERGDGYRDHSEWQKGTVFSRFGYKLDEKSNIRVTLHSYKITWDAPGSLSKADWDADNLKKATTDGGGDKQKYMASIDYSRSLSNSSEINIVGYGYHSDFTRWVGANNEERNDVRETFGTRAMYFLSSNFAGMENGLIIGTDYEFSKSEAHKWSVQNPKTRERKAETLSGEFDFHNISLYFQDDFRPLPFVKLSLGSRYEIFTGDLSNQLSKKESSYNQDVFDPKAGILITPVKGFDIFGNVGTGFVLPAGFKKFENTTLDPSRLISYEVGARFQPVTQAQLQLALFRTDGKDEVITDPITLVETNAGKTRREGVEGSAEYYFTPDLFVYLNGVYQKAKYTDRNTKDGDFTGNYIERVPKYIASTGIEYFPAKGFGGSLTGSYTGERWSDAKNTLREDDFFVANASLRYAWQKYTVTLFVNNLFDKKYSELQTSGSSYNPCDPLNITLSLSMKF
jgi:iron complex outermembrane recepter protein